jgi:hypothetical protein
MKNKILIIPIVTTLTMALIANYLLFSRGTVVIETDPKDAIILIDKVKVNKPDGSDAIIQLKKTTHSIIIISNGYKKTEDTFKPRVLGKTRLKYKLNPGDYLLGGLPYEDSDFYVYGYLSDKYEPVYKISLFNKTSKTKAVDYLRRRGVDGTNATLIFTEESETGGEAAPN